MIENIRLAFQGIWSHKLRSFLTMLGIIIGIASLISIVSSITGTNEQIKRNLIGSGNNVVRLQLYQEEWLYEPNYNGLPEGIGPITGDIAAQLQDFDHTEAVSLYNRRTEYSSSLFYRENQYTSFEMLGVENSYFSTCDFALTGGRMFTPKDFTDYQNVMILEDRVAKDLFPGDNPLGKTIEFKSVPFTVVGTIGENNAFQPVINNQEDYYLYMQNSTAGRVFIPYTSWALVYAYDEPQEVVIRADSTDSLSDLGRRAADFLNSTHKNPEIQYKADNVLQTAKNLQELNRAANTQMIWISLISLLVGGIGVMNIMLVSVTERTREIGLKKAIGARKSRILWQFLTEAAVLSSLGGVLGVVSGIAFSYIFAAVTKTPAALSFPAIILAVAFSMAIGILFGLIPSVKAANLNPIDALRQE